MKRFIHFFAAVSLVSLVNIVALVILAGGLRVSGAGPNPPCVGGDVNGDFALDLADPIYLLEHLFQSGPEPVACAQGPTEVIVTNTPDVNVVGMRPRPEDIVNLSGTAMTAGTGTTATLYDVPLGRWLIVTDLEIQVPGDDPAELLEETAGCRVPRSSDRASHFLLT